jgi:phage tail protein X
MRRHKEFNKTKKTEDFNDYKKVVYKTTLFPKIERHVSDIYIEARDGDRLDNLAYQYYKDVTLWWIIAQANHIGKGTMYIEPGQKIRIPEPNRAFEIVNMLTDIQEERL